MKHLEGQTLGGRYRVVRLLGQGGMGAVFEAVQLDLGRRVALKVLLDVDPRSVERFRREASAASSLASPHLAAVHDFHAEGDTPFLVMELLEGQSLAALLRAERRIEPARAVRIACQVLVALETAHRAGILHRDVKPSNIWLQTWHVGPGSGDHVKLLDFGIAKLTAHGLATLTTATSLIGSPAYLAPEQIRGLDVDARSDLHAVGAVLFEMIAGERPFRGEGSALLLDIVGRAPPPLHAVVPGIPLALSIVVARALAKDPEVRHARADEMRAALSACFDVPASGLPQGAPVGAGGVVIPARRASSRVFVVGLVVPIALASVAGAGFAWSSRRAGAERGAASTVPSAAPMVAAASSRSSPPADAADASSPFVSSTAPTPPSSASLPVKRTSGASKPAPGAPTCECHTARGALICTLPKPPVCSCHGPGQTLTCPVPFAADDTCPDPGPPVFGPYSGVGRKTGDACTGYGPSEPTRLQTGTLSCQTCWGHESLNGVQGSPCTGFISWEPGAVSGTLVCR